MMPTLFGFCPVSGSQSIASYKGCSGARGLNSRVREVLSSSSPSFGDYCHEKRERLMENSQGLHAEETALVKTPHLSSGPPGAASSRGRCVLAAPQHAMLTQLG